MKIDTSQGNVEVIGDVKEFKTSIDPKNLEYITTLLSSNLYSDPEQSFIREIVSNAWDSHVEAGTTDTPVIIRFSGDSITIRDYGTGLSPERFKEVYCNIGSSTKRESNDYIGGFGIGKYSSLACSNTVYITSYYEGTAYYYLMVKSGNSITTNLLMSQSTQEKNGVEVTIKGIKNLDPYLRALYCIIFFPNVYVDGASNACRINGAKLKRFNNFAASSIPVQSKILLGNVLYPVQKLQLNNDARNFIDNIWSTGIVIKFDIGEINITPNRENIIYSSDTVKRINDRIIAAREELNGLIASILKKDYDDILEYHTAISCLSSYDPIANKLATPYNDYDQYKVNPEDFPSGLITYNGKDYTAQKRVIANILAMNLPNQRGILYNDRIYTCAGRKLPYLAHKCAYLRSPHVIMLGKNDRLTQAAKNYIRNKHCEGGIISYTSVEDLHEYVQKNHIICGVSPETLKDIVNGVYESLMRRTVKLDLSKDTEFLAFKSSMSTKGTNVKDTRDVILHVIEKSGYRNSRTFSGMDKAVKYIGGLKKGVILTNMDANDSMFSKIAETKNYAYIKARKDVVEEIRNMKLRCIIDPYWLITKDPMLSVVKTLVKHFPSRLNSESIYKINLYVDSDMQKEFLRLLFIDKKYRYYNIYEIMSLKDSIPYDPYTEYLCLKLKDYMKKQAEAENLSKTLGCTSPILTTAVLIKTKSFRVSSEAYKKYRNNKLLNVLCKK